jgi:hypothetical protein
VGGLAGVFRALKVAVGFFLEVLRINVGFLLRVGVTYT